MINFGKEDPPCRVFKKKRVNLNTETKKQAQSKKIIHRQLLINN